MADEQNEQRKNEHRATSIFPKKHTPRDVTTEDVNPPNDPGKLPRNAAGEVVDEQGNVIERAVAPKHEAGDATTPRREHTPASPSAPSPVTDIDSGSSRW